MFERRLFATMLLCSVSLWGQGGLLGRLTGQGKDNKDNNNSQNAAQTEAAAAPEESEGTVAEYLEMRAFAEGLYNQIEGSGDTRRASAFKRRADAEIEAMRKKDMERAFQMNTSAQSTVRYVIEDRFRVYDGLYDNPVVQTLANRVGQSVVPLNVGRLYTFKLVADPVPWAESLSTGTVWVSTGMVSLMSSKAQLAYVLAHEAAHAYLDHHRQRALLELAQEEYNRQLTENGENRQRRLSMFGAVAGAAGGALIGGLSNGGGGALAGSLLGAGTGGLVTGLIAGATNPRLMDHTEWSRYEEDEADRLAFDWLLQSNMDVRQVPDVYYALRDIGDRDPQIKLGFLGRTDRIRERLETLQARLTAAEAEPGWGNRIWESSDPDFDLLLAEVKRDNGVFAFQYDMMETARTNLKAAVAVKTQDPTALYFYGKVLLQTARTDEERAEADDYFRRAAQYDYRNQNFGSHLHRAVAMLTGTDATAADKKQAVNLLKLYILGYHLAAAADQEAQAEQLPPHVESVYDYMARAGEFSWTLSDDVIKQAQQAMAAGTPLVDYVDPGTGQPTTAVEVSTQQPPQAAKPAAAKPKPAAAKSKPNNNKKK